MKRHLLLFFGLLFTVFILEAQESPWQKTSLRNTSSMLLKKGISTDAYLLRSDALRARLKTSSSRSVQARSSSNIVAFPSRSGDTEDFEVKEVSVLSPALAKKYPGIRSYRGVSVADPDKEIRFSIDDFGLHATVHDAEGTYYINPTHTDKDLYYLASRKDFSPYEKAFICALNPSDTGVQLRETPTSDGGGSGSGPNDGMLRTYRMALACTGEFAQFHIDQAGVSQGTEIEKKTAVLAAMNTIMTRVNDIYERDLSVFLQLVDNNDALIFLDADTDGFTNDQGSTLIEEIQDVIDSTIGTDNYDLGHIFSTGGGGVAEVGSLCSENKAKGVTGTSSPMDDPFAIDFVAHEIGHQLGATHTFNNLCSTERSNHTAVEPGSGSTIMAYSGICPPNIQMNSDAYFHAVSISQIWNLITSSSCGLIENTGNQPPQVQAGEDKVIPPGTPFVLSGTASDPDNDALTYSWEQTDNQVYEGYPDSSSPGGPLFRSLPPTEIPVRYFPREDVILSGSFAESAWEVLPEINRELNFSFLVRDNRSGGGQTGRDQLRLTVADDATALVVTSHSTTTTLTSGQAETVSWDVGGTNSGTISAETTDIYLLPDNDLNNRIPLAEGIPNNGEATVIIPGGITSSEARIMVKPSDQVFFAINKAPLNIIPSDYSLEFEELTQTICTGEEASYSFVYHTHDDFSDTTYFSVEAPEGIDISITPESASADSTEVTITASGDTEGTHSLQLLTTPDPATEIPLTLRIQKSDFDTVNLSLPENGATEVSPDGLALEWEALDNADRYEIQLSETSDFSVLTQQDIVAFPLFRPSSLQNDHTYYWRVKPLNNCGEGTYGTPFSFSTPITGCSTYTSNDIVTIPENTSGTVTSTLEITDSDLITGGITVALNITHSWVSDLSVTLSSPSGTTVRLFSNICSGSENIEVIFSDAGESLSCNNNPAIGGTVRPDQPLTAFRGEELEGIWTLNITDDHISDGGTINAFNITRCPDPAPDNFVVKTTEVSCEGNDDGLISVSALATLPYQVTIEGNGIQRTENFTEHWTAENLSEGIYTLCFTVAGNPSFQQCQDVEIALSSGLSVIPIIHEANNSLELQLNGGQHYTINLNGTVTETESENIVLPLDLGENTLSVTSERECQGRYETRIHYNPKDIVLYPNPFTGPVYASIGNQIEGPFHIRVYSISGILMVTATYEKTSANILLEDLQGLTPGVYIVSIKGRDVKKTVKLIKRPL
ncbi:reprolysin-like metallopeptidase [Sinomicrobium sp.]